jgi:hypothetical protein
MQDDNNGRKIEELAPADMARLTLENLVLKS